jgi:Double sensory domain of two-component sensor kinase
VRGRDTAATLSLAVLLGVALGLATAQANRLADQSLRRGLADVQRGVQLLLAGRAATLAGMSRVSVQDAKLRERLRNRDDHADALDQAERCRALLGAAWVLVTNERGVLVLRTDHPEEVDADLSRGALVAGALSGESSSGAWLDERLHRLFMAVAVPLGAASAEPAKPEGALVAAYALDDSLALEMKRSTTADVVLFALDTLDRPYVIGSTLPREAVGPALAADTGALRRFASDSGVLEVAALVGGEHLIGVASPIRSGGGDAFGGIIVFRSREREAATFTGLRRTVAVAFALALAVALFVSAKSLRTTGTPGPPSIRPAADR